MQFVPYCMWYSQCAIQFGDMHCVECRLHGLQSICLLALRNGAAAVQAANQAIQLDPSEPMHFMARMNALQRIGKIDAAIADAEHISQLDRHLGRDLPQVLEQLRAEQRRRRSRQ
jgi:hypothetical protein